MADDPVLLFEDFESTGPELPEGWWVEGGEQVWVEDGHLRVQSDPDESGKPGHVCTVWYEKPFAGDLQVEFDARVLHSTVDANNINFFLFYTDPEGRDLYETRESRSSGAYSLYHNMNGYIFTFLNDYSASDGRHADGSTKARMRMRRCPGFQLMTETFESTCEKDVTYRVRITRKGGDLTFGVDGKVYLTGRDDEPWREGLIGLRTFKTDLWWDNIRITGIR